MPRLLIINNIPTPYRTFMFNRLHAHGKARGIDVQVAFQAAREKRRPWKPEDFQMEFPHFISTGWGLGSARNEYANYATVNLDIVRALRDPAVRWVVAAPFQSIGMWWLTLRLPRHVTGLLWCESNLTSSRFNRGPGKWLKSQLIARYPILVCPGRRAVEYLAAINPTAATKPVLWLPNIVDVSVFRGRVAAERPNRAAIRAELGIGDDTQFIFAIGRITESKGFGQLPAAVARVPGKYRILVYGGGERRDEWIAKARELNIEDRLQFPGEIPEKEVARRHAAADWFLHPALHDPSPLVTIEATNAGVPMAVSQATGNAPEVVDEGRNGFTFDSTSIDATAAAIERMVRSSAEERRAMGRASDELSVERFDPDRVCTRFFDELVRFAPPR
ncbi:MAG: glycosyltransferase family 4 protein [Phycisphaerae bacterium]|nr:glycosyltransferase family 4 protein [Phycisphaerae bacterium]